MVDRRIEGARIAQAAARARPKSYDPPEGSTLANYDSIGEKPAPTPEERSTPRHSPKLVLPLDFPFRVKVSGVSFAPNYPDNLAALERAQFDRYVKHGDEKLPAIFVRDPDNEYDSNAVRIEVPALGDTGFVGHVPAHLAARLAPSLDQGDIWQAFVHQVAVKEGLESRPGLWIEAQPIAESP